MAKKTTKKKTTSEAQIQYTMKYLGKQKRFVIWYPADEKEKIQKAIEEQGIFIKDVFKAGLICCGIDPENLK